MTGHLIKPNIITLKDVEQNTNKYFIKETAQEVKLVLQPHLKHLKN